MLEQIQKRSNEPMRFAMRTGHSSAVIVGDSMDELIVLANRFAAEHVNLQVKNEQEVLAKLTHAGAVFVGPYSPVAAGDCVARSEPVICLPGNTTARFSSGITRVYEFLKRSSMARYESAGLSTDARCNYFRWLNAEHLDAHANSCA